MSRTAGCPTWMWAGRSEDALELSRPRCGTTSYAASHLLRVPHEAREMSALSFSKVSVHLNEANSQMSYNIKRRPLGMSLHAMEV